MSELQHRRIVSVLLNLIRGVRAGAVHDAGGAANAIAGLAGTHRDERAERFIRQLASAIEEEQLEAELVLRSLIEDPRQHKLLQHLTHEVLLGTERISLAAMAILAAQTQHDPSDGFYPRIARAIDGLADSDAVVFLILFVTEDFRKPYTNLWRPNFMLDVGKIGAHSTWADAMSVVSLNEDIVFSAVSELKSRRLILDEDTTGKWGGDHVAPVRFAMSADSARAFKLLHRAMRVAEPELFARLSLGHEGRAQDIWDRYAAHRPTT